LVVRLCCTCQKPRGLGGFNIALIGEAESLSRQLRERPTALTSPENTRRALEVRNRVATLLVAELLWCRVVSAGRPVTETVPATSPVTQPAPVFGPASSTSIDCLLAMPSRGRHNRTMLVRSAAVWSKVRQRKLEHWAEQNRKEGPLASLRSAEALRAHVVSMRPDWPDAQTRRADWANHKKMRMLFDRMAHALVKKPRSKAVR
jgi:hypothetical protein